MPARFTLAEGPVSFNSVLVDVDESTGRALSIERVDRVVDIDRAMAEKERDD